MFYFISKPRQSRSASCFVNKRRYVVDGRDKRPAIKHRVAKIGKVHEVQIIFHEGTIKTALLGKSMPVRVHGPLDKLLTAEVNLRCVLLHHINIKRHILMRET